jgi:hypothetical protein
MERAMGYTTRFSGTVKLGRKLTMAEAKELLEIDSAKTGIDAYFQWVPADTFEHIVWDGEEKFYKYVEQLQWLCGDWLDQRGIAANGALYWAGEETGDTGTITVTANVVSAHPNRSSAGKGPRPLTLRDLQEMALEQITSA